CLLEIDDIDSVAFTENVLLHLRIPALGLVSKMDASLQKFLHCNRRQTNLRFKISNISNLSYFSNQKSPAGRRSLKATIKHLPLRELEAFSRSRLSVFLAFLRARISGQKPGLLQNLPQVGAETNKSPGDAVLNGASLSMLSTTLDDHNHIEFV